MKAYLRLFRWPNLLVVLLTQVLLRYAIIIPLLALYDTEPALSHMQFAMLVLATLFITAAGYAINDYFDLRIDRINKPEKIVLGKHLSRRTAIISHSLLNATGLLLGLILAISIGQWQLTFIFIVVPALLWMYSIRYKRKFFIGNFIVSLMSAFVLVVVWVFDFQAFQQQFASTDQVILQINYLVQLYAIFAFLTTLGREIIKDVEDIAGDEKTGCKTLPVVVGIKGTRSLILFIHILIILLLAYLQVWLYGKGFIWVIVYLFMAVQIPLVYMLLRIFQTSGKSDYSKLSKMSKLIMLTGILSMVVFYFYFLGGVAVF